MIKLILRATLLAAMLMAFTAIANADTVVTYSTQARFLAWRVYWPGTVQTAAGAGFLQFTGQGSTSVAVPAVLPFFTTAQLGNFSWSGDASGFVLTPFTLQITQTVPGPTGSQSFSALIAGLVQTNPTPFSGLEVVFTSAQVEINGVRYRLTNLGGPGTTFPTGMLINPPGQTPLCKQC